MVQKVVGRVLNFELPSHEETEEVLVREKEIGAIGGLLGAADYRAVWRTGTEIFLII